VVVATGAADGLACAILGLVGCTDVAVVRSITKVDLGGRVIAQHCHAANKLRMLRAAGFDAPIARAYSDSTNDLPLLRAAREPMVVNPSARGAATFRRDLGAGVPILDWCEVR
jgi:phosphatidylglycerophosphatase C